MVNVDVEPAPVAVVVNNLPTICTEGTPDISITSPTTPTTLLDLTFDVTVLLPGGVTGTLLAGNGVLGAVAPFSINTGTLTHDNLTALPLTVIYTITPKLNGCADGTPQIVNVIVRPDPVGQLDNTTLANICSDEAFTYNIQTENIDLQNGVSSNFTFTVSSSSEIDVPTPAGLDRTIASAAVISGNFNNISSADVTITYTITPFNTSSNCEGLPFDVEAVIHPEPTSPLLTTVDICSDDVNNFDLQALVIDNVGGGGNTVPSKFKYTVVSDFPMDVFPAANRTTATIAAITDAYTNLSNHDVTITYTVTPVSLTGDCEGTPFDFEIVIHPEPVGINILDPVCSTALNHNIQASHINAVGGNSLPSVFTYVFIPDPLNPTVLPIAGPPYDRLVASALNITDNFLNTTGIDATVTYLITPFNAANPTCAGTDFTYKVKISPKPQAGPFTEPDVCSNVPFTFNPQDVVNDISTVPPGNSVVSTFTWTVAYDPGIVVKTAGTSGNSISETLLNRTSGAAVLNAVYTVTPTAGTCVGDDFDITVPIKAEPVVETNLNTTRCSGDIFNKDLATVMTSIGALDYTVSAVVDPDLIIGLVTTGINQAATAIRNDFFFNFKSVPLKVIYTITPNGLNGCVGEPKVVEFTINPEPVIQPQIIAAICSNNINNPTITNIVLGGDGISVGAANYRISIAKEYSSNAGPFGPGLPSGFTEDIGNATVGSPSGINLIKNDKYTNISEFQVVVRYTIVPQGPVASGSCDGDPVIFDVPINPEPILDDALNPSNICSGITIEGGNPGFELKAETLPIPSVAAASFIIRSISFPGLTAGASNTGIGAGKDKDAMDNDTYINVTNSQLIATYTIAPVSAAGCVGADQTVEVRVDPSPALKTGLDRIVCSDDISNIVLQDNSPTSVSAATYDIISVTVGGTPIPPGATVSGLAANASNSILGITADVDQIRNDQFVNPTTDRIIVSYQIVPVSTPGCRGPQGSITLTVEPQIVSVSGNGAPSICSGSPISLTFASPTYANGAPTNPVVTFSYTMVAVTGVSGNTIGNNLSEGTTITDILVNTTDNPITVNYKVTPRASAASNGVGCTGTVEDVFIVVQPRPKINAISNKTICEEEPVSLSLISTTVPSTGSIKFFVTAVPSSANVTGFTNNSFALNNTVLPDILINNGSITESVTYTLEPRNVDGADVTICAGPAIEVIVTVSPRPVITPITNFSICSGEPFDPIAIVTDTENAIPGSTLVTWTVTPDATITGESNGAGNSFSQVLFNNSNDKKTVTYIINAKNITNSPACSGTPLTLNVTVYPVPKIISLPSSVNVCNNGTLNPNPYVLTSSVVESLSPVFDWIVDDGDNPDLENLPAVTNGTAINQTFVNNGSFLGTYQYTITPHLTIPADANPLVGNTCTGQEGIMVVNVAPPVTGEIYGFNINGEKANELFLCRGAKEFVYIDPIGLPLMEVVYKEGSTTKTLTKLGGLTILQVSPENTTIYELISVKDKFGCVKEINQTVTVNVDAVSNEFSIVGPDIACSPFQVQFKHDQVAGVNYTWKWLDGPDSTTYQATSSVAGQIIKHTFVNPSPSTSSKFKVSLEAFLDTLKYQVGCKKLPFVKEIRVYPTISTGVFPDNTVLCSGETVKFVNTSQGVSASGHTWFYRVQGSSQEIDVRTTSSVSYTMFNESTSNPIIYDVVYKSTNGNCPAEEVVTPITVYRGATPGFNEGDVPPHIGGHSIVTFTNTTTPQDEIDFRYEWEFGADGIPASANGIGPFTIDYTTPGDKDVILTVTNIGAEAEGRSCVAEFRKTINIELLPLVAEFIATPQAACFPSDITVTENTSTGDVMEWRVVDSNGRVAATSNANLPIFQITNPGKYSIFLRTSSSFTGQEANSQQDNFEVYPVPVASFDARPTLLYVPDTELLTYNFTTGATDYLWDFGDNGTSTEEEPSYVYKIEGVYDLTLIAMNDHGDGVVCSDTLSRQITAKQGGITKVPNAFTPNPNGPNGGVSSNGSFNDVFLPYVKGAEEFNMQIFDRWGNLIFESNNSTIGWDGYDRNGRLLSSGVYVYKLTLRLSDGQRTTQIGDITMIR